MYIIEESYSDIVYLDMKSTSDFNALIIAASEGLTLIALKLIKKYDVLWLNCTNSNSDTALIFVSERDSRVVVSKLIEKRVI